MSLYAIVSSENPLTVTGVLESISIPSNGDLFGLLFKLKTLHILVNLSDTEISRSSEYIPETMSASL